MRDEYNTAAQRHMLRTLTHVEDIPLKPGSRSSSPEAFTPLSSPPRPTASASPAEGTPTQLRTSVTTSPNLSDIRRGRAQGDKTSSKQARKEQLVATRRSSRSSTSGPQTRTPCCNPNCRQIRPPLTASCASLLSDQCTLPVQPPPSDPDRERRICVHCHESTYQC